MGIRNEAVATCYAMQKLERTSMLLGTTRDYGRALAEIAWRYYAHFGPSLHGRDYWTPRCRNGGPLDLNPRSSVWP